MTEENTKRKDCVEGGAGTARLPYLSPAQTGRTPSQGKLVLWTHPRVETFPCIKEPDMTKETKEQTALRRLRSRLKPFKCHPNYKSAVCQSDKILLGWLTTFDLNVYTVEARLKRHCQARASMELDTILTDYKPPEVLKYHYTAGLCGVDREKRPIWYELIGCLDMDSLANSLTMKDLVRHKFYQLERLKKAVEDSEASQIVVIVDMEGLPCNVLGPAMEVWRQYIKIVQDHYPYLVHEYIIVNPSSLLTDFTLNLRPYLDRLTRSKVTVLGRNVTKYLVQRIEKHHIPAYLGGYKCDIDNGPFCKEDLIWTGVVSNWMHIYPHVSATAHWETLRGGQRLVRETHVATHGSHVTWGFYFLNKPISLSIYINRIEPKTCNTIKYVAGTTCEGACRYITVLDNRKDLASAAKCIYKVLVQPPIWIQQRLALQRPIGEDFSMDNFVGEDERKLRQWKISRDPQYKWKQQLVQPKLSTTPTQDPSHSRRTKRLSE